MITITTAAQRVERDGLQGLWADDPGLTDIQRAALRASGRSEVQRRYNERGQYLNTAGQGMGQDGRQAQVTAPTKPAPSVAPEQTVAGDRAVSDAALDNIDGVFELDQMPGQPNPPMLDPLSAALLSRGNGAAPAPTERVITTTESNGGASTMLPLIGLAGMFLL